MKGAMHMPAMQRSPATPKLLFRGLILTILAFLTYHFLFASSSTAYKPWQIPALPDNARQLFEKHAVNGTVMFVPVNSGMLQWSENLLCSLKAINYDPSNIVFWALDAKAEQILTRQGRPAYYDSTLYGSSLWENHKGDTAAFKRMMKERPKFYLDVLSAGFDMMMIDTDVVFFQSPETLIPSSGIDAVFSTDAREFFQDKNAFKDKNRRGSLMPPVCNGIFWQKANEASIDLWRIMLDVFLEPSWSAWFRRNTYFQDDQRGMDVLLNDGRAQLVGPLPGGIAPEQVPRAPGGEYRVQLLDQTQVVNGHLLLKRMDHYDQNLKKLRLEGKDRIAAHFNWGTTELPKEVGSKKYGMWFVNEDGSCKAQ